MGVRHTQGAEALLIKCPDCNYTLAANAGGLFQVLRVQSAHGGYRVAVGHLYSIGCEKCGGEWRSADAVAPLARLLAQATLEADPKAAALLKIATVVT